MKANCLRNFGAYKKVNSKLAHFYVMLQPAKKVQCPKAKQVQARGLMDYAIMP